VNGFTITRPGCGFWVISSDIVISNNLIVDNVGYGIFLADWEPGYEMVSELAGNTIVGNGGTGVEYRTWQAFGTHNIVVGHRDYGFKGQDFTYDLLYCCDAWGNGNDYYLPNSDAGLDGNISEDPRFCDPVNGDYTLAADSPCLSPATQCDYWGPAFMGVFGQGCDVPTGLGMSESWGKVKALFGE
jgi:hypothetical protein